LQSYREVGFRTSRTDLDPRYHIVMGRSWIRKEKLI
jgi:hypothetical protein